MAELEDTERRTRMWLHFPQIPPVLAGSCNYPLVKGETGVPFLAPFPASPGASWALLKHTFALNFQQTLFFGIFKFPPPDSYQIQTHPQ